MTAIARGFASVLFVLLVLCRAASADQFTVTGGSIRILDRSHADFTLTGDDFSLGGFAESITVHESCFPCSANRPSITISGSLGNPESGQFGGAPGTFAGVDYPHLIFTGLMSVSTPSFPGSMLRDSTTITLPFDFSAQLRGFPNTFNYLTGPVPTPIFPANIFAGSGTATVNFMAIPPAPGTVPLFEFHDATFVFSPSSTAPVPEPATVTLFVIGAATALVRRRKR
jgi:hypothetical protein